MAFWIRTEGHGLVNLDAFALAEFFAADPDTEATLQLGTGVGSRRLAFFGPEAEAIYRLITAADPHWANDPPRPRPETEPSN